VAIAPYVIQFIGLFFGAYLGYRFSIRQASGQEKERKEERAVDVASALYDDVSRQVVAVIGIEVSYESYPKNSGPKTYAKTQLNREMFQAFVPEIHVLPRKVIGDISAFYNSTILYREEIWSCFDYVMGSGGVISQSDELKSRVPDLCRGFLKLAESALIELVMVAENVKEDKARSNVSTTIRKLRAQISKQIQEAFTKAETEKKPEERLIRLKQ
jgi:hypothetical protein